MIGISLFQRIHNAGSRTNSAAKRIMHQSNRHVQRSEYLSCQILSQILPEDQPQTAHHSLFENRHHVTRNQFICSLSQEVQITQNRMNLKLSAAGPKAWLERI